MPIFSIEETFGASGKIERSKTYLEATYPELLLPAYAVMMRGDTAFSTDLNISAHQHLEAYSTPFRIPKLDVKVSSYKLEGTNTKLVNVILWYKPRRNQKEVKG